MQVYVCINKSHLSHCHNPCNIDQAQLISLFYRHENLWGDFKDVVDNESLQFLRVKFMFLRLMLNPDQAGFLRVVFSKEGERQIDTPFIFQKKLIQY